MEPQKDLKTLIEEALDLRNLNLERLAQVTGIPERYLSALKNGETAKLPAVPYVRGYLKKIASVLHLNYEEVWSLYEKELAHKTSGAHDKLPVNRFAIKAFDKKWLIGGLAVALLLIYLLVNQSGVFGTPYLEVTAPDLPTTLTGTSTIFLTGKTDNKNKLTVNGEQVLTDSQGNFELPFNLQLGLNTIEFKAKRLLGKEATVIRQVIYQPTGK